MSQPGSGVIKTTRSPASGGTGEAAQRVTLRALTLRTAFCLAGDMTADTDEKHILEQLQETDPDGLYAECLRLLVGRRAVRDFAEQEWNTLLAHRAELERTLGRPIGLQTAALDFFSEARTDKPELVVVSTEVFETLSQEARIDAITGLFTQGSFQWALDQEVRRARRYHRCLVLVLVDVDDMQILTTRRGAEYGDFVLREVAQLILKNIRNTDTAAHLETDIFALLLHECKLNDGRNLAERLRAAVERQTFSLSEGDEGAHLTATFSVVGYPESSDSSEKLLTRAQELLSEAKRQGKNRVIAADGVEP